MIMNMSVSELIVHEAGVDTLRDIAHREQGKPSPIKTLPIGIH